MGGKYKSLGTRHSRKSRPVPVRRPSIPPGSFAASSWCKRPAPASRTMPITLSQTEPGMTSQSLRNDAEHWRTRAEEVRMLASEEKNTTTKDALLRTADDYKLLAR